MQIPFGGKRGPSQTNGRQVSHRRVPCIWDARTARRARPSCCWDYLPAGAPRRSSRDRPWRLRHAFPSVRKNLTRQEREKAALVSCFRLVCFALWSAAVFCSAALVSPLFVWGDGMHLRAAWKVKEKQPNQSGRAKHCRTPEQGKEKPPSRHSKCVCRRASIIAGAITVSVWTAIPPPSISHPGFRLLFRPPAGDML